MFELIRLLCFISMLIYSVIDIYKQTDKERIKFIKLPQWKK